MTRKDYVLIAGAIKEIYEYQKDSDGKGSKAIKQGAIRVTAEAIADELQHDNFRFDRSRFLEACGVQCPHNNTEWRDEKGKSYLNCFDCGEVLRTK